jgi:hypothetical protein
MKRGEEEIRDCQGASIREDKGGHSNSKSLNSVRSMRRTRLNLIRKRREMRYECGT